MTPRIGWTPRTVILGLACVLGMGGGLQALHVPPPIISLITSFFVVALMLFSYGAAISAVTGVKICWFSAGWILLNTVAVATLPTIAVLAIGVVGGIAWTEVTFRWIRPDVMKWERDKES